MEHPMVEEQVKVAIANDELAKKATSAAHHFRTVQELEDEVKSFSKSKKIEIEDHKAKASMLLEEVRLGYRYETVMCLVVRDHEEQEVYLIDRITCNMIRSRQMNSDETQMAIQDNVPNVSTYEDMKKIRAKLEEGETTKMDFFYGLIMPRHPISKNIKDWARKTKSEIIIPDDPVPESVCTIFIRK